MSTAAAAGPRSNPFPGLRPFREDEEHLFFGRENQVDAMVDKLAATRFLAVVGTSGSGKSSLVNCGLRPALRQGLMSRAGTAWRMAQFRPGNNPIGAMARTLAQGGVLFREHATEGATLAEIIDTTLRMSKLGLIDIFEMAPLDQGVNLLVVVDQFEELFRYRQLAAAERGGGQHGSEEAAAFVNLLLEVKQQEARPIFVVMTMRSDFLGDCTQFPGLAEAINAGQYLVPRMTRDERRAAIEGPVRVGGAEIAPVLLTRLVNDVGDNPDQLSILQHALNRTWARWQDEGREKEPLDLPQYEAIGTMAHALDQHAEQAYTELDATPQQQICEKLFKGLTDKATDPRGVRRPTALRTLCALADATAAEVTDVIDVFRDPSRSFLMPPAGEALEADAVIDISHESLMRVWQRLNTWADEEAQSAQAYRRLADAAALHAAGTVSLWRDPELHLALDWRDHGHPNETWAARYHTGFAAAMDFLDESLALRQREESEREAARQAEIRRQQELAEAAVKLATEQRRRARIALVGVIVALLLAVFGGYEAYTSNKNEKMARENAQIATADRLSASGLLNMTENYELGLLLTIQGMKTHDTYEVRNSLLSLLQANGRLRSYLHPGGTLAFSPDGDTLASGDYFSGLQIWDLNSFRSSHVAVQPVTVAISPDGHTLASGGTSDDLDLVELKTGRVFVNLNTGLPAVHRIVNSVAFSPDGKILASGGCENAFRAVCTSESEGVIRLWNLEKYEITTEIHMPGTKWKEVYGLAFSPNGLVLAVSGCIQASGQDGWSCSKTGVQLWDLAQMNNPKPLGEPLVGVGGRLAFDPFKSILATQTRDGGIQLWDLDSRSPLGDVLSHGADQISALAFSHDGKLLATGTCEAGKLLGQSWCNKGEVWIWDLADINHPKILDEPLTGHAGAVTSVAFSPDDATIASSAKGTINIWNHDIRSAPHRLATRINGHPLELAQPVSALAVGPNNAVLATAAPDGIIRLWDRSSDKLVESALAGHNISGLTFSHNGRTLASAGADGVRFWDVTSGLTSRGPIGQRGSATNAIAFSSDDRTAASVANDGRMYFWDVESGRQSDGPVKVSVVPLYGVAFNPDGGDVAVVCRDGSIYLFDFRTRERLGDRLIIDSRAAKSVAFDPKGGTLAVGNEDGEVGLFDTTSRKLISRLAGHFGAINKVTFSPNGDVLASAGMDGTIRLWDVGEHRSLGRPFVAYPGAIADVAFGSDGATLVSGGAAGVLVWDVSVKSWLDQACRIVGRNLSQSEWQQYVGKDVPYERTCSSLPADDQIAH